MAARRNAEGATGSAPGGSVSLSEPLMDCAAAAALLSVRVSWVRDAARLGQLPCLRVGRHLRFTRPMLEEWLTGQLDGTPAGRARGVQPGQVAGAGRGRAFRGRPADAALLAALERPKGR
jgi:excisionase family DNA binding protein